MLTLVNVCMGIMLVAITVVVVIGVVSLFFHLIRDI